MSETAQILPDNYYQILLKNRVVSVGQETARTLPRYKKRPRSYYPRLFLKCPQIRCDSFVVVKICWSYMNKNL